jgi:AraC-like DNA-binding protein
MTSEPWVIRGARELLRATQVRQHLNFMRQRGFAAAEVLAGTMIDAARLPDSAYLVEARDCHRVVANVLELSGDPGIGLRIGHATRINDLGIVGYAMASASTLGAAISLWLQYGNARVGFPFNLQLLDRPPKGRWGVTAAPGVSGLLYRFYVEEIAAMGVGLGRTLTGEPFVIEEAAFSYPAPRHARQYLRRFRCPIVFDAPLTRIVVRSPGLDSAVKSDDSELRELCIRHCSLLVRQIERHGPVTSRLRTALTTMGSIPSLDQAADALNMSPRSFRRHLAAEGTSFQRALDEFRADLAREYLGAGMMPAKEVAFLLGFSHVNAFRAAFKAWTGQTVGAFQATPQRHRAANGGRGIITPGPGH